MMTSLPELLAPAGSPAALDAALAAGADAVYLGGSRFNARMNAHNFGRDELFEAVTHAHRMGGRVYLTLNTLVYDRELPAALEAAYEAATAGVDALIIADLGAAALIRRALPGLPLHASTQLSGHNAHMGDVLAPFGFSRFVIARETSLEDLAVAVRDNPLEVEVFIHGALCVSHSGQCLFSSLVGGRSGNRGECAQPCRLPYGCASCSRERSTRIEKGRSAGRHNDQESLPTERENYPLSLKDLSLASHVPALLETGVASLKIEGRMKSPGYVGGVTAIWRRLLNERRAATPEELSALSDLFSRGGFTDGYQTGHIDRRMMGVRSEADKDRTAAAEKNALSAKHPPHLPVAMTLTVRERERVTLTAEAPLYRQGSVDPHLGVHAIVPDIVTVTVSGDMPTPVDENGLTAETAERQLARTGGTPYRLTGLTATIGTTADGHALSVPLSALNVLRREVITALDTARTSTMPVAADEAQPIRKCDAASLVTTLADTAETVPMHGNHTVVQTARFRLAKQITPAAMAAFDRLYLPLGESFPVAVPTDKQGFILPPVIFDREADAVSRMLETALSQGVRHILVGNLGHIPLVRAVAERRDEQVILHGDFRLNPANTLSASRLLGLGFADIILAPELTVPRMRDIGRALASEGHIGVTAAIVYGRLPLMLLEKCAIREVYRNRDPAAVCRDICAADTAVLVDRLGKSFPILREDAPEGRGHRNSVYNSLPLSVSDRTNELTQAALGQHHFLFSVESPREVDRVIDAYRTGQPLTGDVRRFPK